MPLSAAQIASLDTLNKKIAGGYKPNATDQGNLAYGTSRGYVYKPPTVAPPVSTPSTTAPPVSTPPPVTPPVATSAPVPGLDEKAKFGLDAAAQRSINGTANATDEANLKTAQDKYQYIPSSLSRAGLEATGYSYLGTMAGVNAAKKAGKDVAFLGGSYYIKPKKAAQTTENIRNNQNQNQTDPNANNPDQTPTPNVTPDPIITDFKFPPELTNQTPFPQAPDLTDTYNQLRSANKVEDAEKAVSDAQAALDTLDAAYMAGKHGVGNEMKPMQILRGEQALLGEQYNEQRFLAQNKLSLVQGLLKTKQDVIANIMDMTQKSYDNARQAYNDNFNHAIDLQKMFTDAKNTEWDHARLISNDAADRVYQNLTLQNTIDNQMRDDARANLTTVSNIIKDSGKGWDQVSASMKTQIQSLEVKGGLPPGTMEAFIRSKPKANLLAQVEDGKGNVTFIYANPDGTPGMIKTVRGVGPVTKGSGGGGGTPPSTTGNPWDDVKPVSKVAYSHTPGSGWSFNGLVGTGKNATQGPITMSQYAAATKKNVFSLLNDGGPGDKAVAAKIKADMADAQDSKASINAFTAYLYDSYGWIFNGASPDQIRAMTGYTPAK